MKHKFNSQIPASKASYSTGTRGESSGARNKSGNHTGDRMGSPRKPKVRH